jgi:hypothetical protein
MRELNHWIISIEQYLNLKEMKKNLLMVEMWKLKKIEDPFSIFLLIIFFGQAFLSEVAKQINTI